MADLLLELQRALGDRYTIERELGHGGTAVVYLAQDRKHSRRVAIKVLRPDLAAAIGPERFLREIEIAARLSHPHILPLYDSGATERLSYYVMPVVEGKSLRDRIRAERQPARGVVRPVGGQLAQHSPDERRGQAVQGNPPQVDVVVGLLAGRQDDLAVHHGQVLDQLQQLVAVTHESRPYPSARRDLLALARERASSAPFATASASVRTLAFALARAAMVETRMSSPSIT